MTNDLKVATFHQNQMKKMISLMKEHVEKEPKVGRYYDPKDKMFPELTLKEVEKSYEM